MSPCTGYGTVYATSVTVTITQGSTVVYTGTTSSNTGCLAVTIPSVGTYTIATSGNARYNNTSGSHALTCGGSVVINLTAATGYGCACPWLEPVPHTLTATGGTGSTTFSIAGGFPVNFVLPCSVTVLIPDPFGNCGGTIVADPCTTTTGLNVTFTFFNPGGGPVCSVEELFLCSTDCDQTTCTGSTPSFYRRTVSTGGLVDQWGNPLLCFGYCGFSDGYTYNFVPPLPVPVNVTMTFGVGTFGMNAPISSVTLTE